MLEIQRFVTTVIESMGGIVEPLEYALISVLIPEEYSSIFQGRTELVLSFDFEVAEEHPDSEFITTGSYLLEEMVGFASEKAVTTVRHVIVDQLVLSNPSEKIKKYFNMEREQVDVTDLKEVMGCYVEFNFKVGYTSDERIEETREVWINLLTGKIDSKMMKNKSRIFYTREVEKNYPVCICKEILDAFDESYRYIKEEAQKSSSLRINKMELEKELKRITQYYDELLRENSKKMDRKGVSEERIGELKEKAAALKLEMERQQKEMEYKHSLKIDISLEYGILYFVPLIEYHVNIRAKGVSRADVIYYNPVLKEFMR